jgi:adenylylsulfate kinase
LVTNSTVQDQKIYYADSHVRSIAKALSWRITALIVTGVLVLLITGSLEFAAAVGAADTLLKIGLYYLHERIWVRSRFGREA